MIVVFILILAVLWLGSLLLAAGGIIFLPTLFAAPGSKGKPLLWIFVISLATYPITVILTVLIVLILLVAGNTALASRVIFLPFINLMIFGLDWLYVSLFRKGKF